MIEILFCLVVGITDGDTLTAHCGIPAKYKRVKVRIAAIDTPEMKPEQPYGKEATEALQTVCMGANAKVTIRQGNNKSYSRVVAG